MLLPKLLLETHIYVPASMELTPNSSRDVPMVIEELVRSLPSSLDQEGEDGAGEPLTRQWNVTSRPGGVVMADCEILISGTPIRMII